MLTGALGTAAKPGKQPQCPSAEARVKTTWFIFTTEYDSATTKNEVMPFAATWMDLEMITLNEVSQMEKEKSNITCLWNLKKGYK